MKTRICKLLALVMTLCILTTALTGCTTLNYRKAVHLYNARQYDEAIELFYELGNYEDSAELFTASHYWAAMERMEAGNYGEALPRFLKLGDYEDAADRAKECKYQLAIQAFNEDRYGDAENYFNDLSNYRQTQEYLRQLRWQAFYDYIVENGAEGGGCYVFSSQVGDRAVDIMVDMMTPSQITMCASWEKDMGYVFYDSLTLGLERDTTVAAFTADRRFTMAFGEDTIGSQQTGSGTVDLSTYTPGSPLVLSNFDMTVSDNQGNTTNTQDSVNSDMDEAMAANMSAILECLSILLAQAGVESIF